MTEIPGPADAIVRHFVAGTLNVLTDDGAGRSAISYRLMSPQSTDAASRAPLIVFLHGAGERGSDNLAQLLYLPEVLAREENRRRYPCYVAAPQCPLGSTWCTTNPKAPELHRLGSASLPEGLVAELVREVVATHAVDRRRIYLTGLSMGGFGTWYAAARNPELFAAAAPICGGVRLFDPKRLRDLPIWAVHGADDDVVPCDYSRRAVAAVRSAGGQPRYDELPKVGHDSWTPAYDPSFGLLDWLFAQRGNDGIVG